LSIASFTESGATSIALPRAVLLATDLGPSTARLPAIENHPENVTLDNLFTLMMGLMFI
jgi:hypothetical protein